MAALSLPFMHRLFGFLLLALPLTALAAYDTAHLPYTDAPGDRVTAVATSFLTQEGILQGYPDGTFRPDQPVNRAEFMKVAVLAAPRAFPELDEPVIDPPSPGVYDCFPDVHREDWFSPYVCSAKAVGVVQGDALEGILQSSWRFHPARTVNYAEAAKMLVNAFGIQTFPAAGREWYEPFLAVAETEGIALPGVAPGHALTRGEVAQVVASFLAYSRGELPQLRAAQEGRVLSSSSQSSLSLISSSSSSSVSSRSSVSSFSADPGPDFSQLPAFIRLGTTSAILGAAKIFNDVEPFVVTDITVTFTGSVPTVDEVLLFASADHRVLGSASRDSSDPSSFLLHKASGILSAPKREDVSVYARAITRAFDGGGVSGEDVRIDHFTVAGHGGWSNRSYSQSTIETYQIFETARSTFIAIANAGPAGDVLVSGVGRTLGAFRFTGGSSDGRADLRLTNITFSLGMTGNVSLANVALRGDGSTDQTGCTAASDTITCASVPASIGTVVGGQRTLTLTGDITVPGSSQNAGLQVSLTPAGSASSAGAVTWTDGTTSFQWVPFDESSLRGTAYRF